MCPLWLFPRNLPHANEKEHPKRTPIIPDPSWIATMRHAHHSTLMLIQVLWYLIKYHIEAFPFRLWKQWAGQEAEALEAKRHFSCFIDLILSTFEYCSQNENLWKTRNYDEGQNNELIQSPVDWVKVRLKVRLKVRHGETAWSMLSGRPSRSRAQFLIGRVLICEVVCLFVIKMAESQLMPGWGAPQNHPKLDQFSIETYDFEIYQFKKPPCREW